MTGWILAAALAQALDAGSSCAAFARGFHEANPLLSSSCHGLVVTKAGVTVAASVAVSRLGATHPRLARAAAVALIAVPSYAVVHNFSQLKGRR